MAYLFTARAVPGVFTGGSDRGYEERSGSFTIVKWPDGTTRFGAPTELAWTSDLEQLPDLLNLPYLSVSGRLRDLIDHHEPGLHEFYPVRITLPNGRSEQRYLLHIKQQFDAVSAEHSRWEKASDVLWKRPAGRDKRLVFSAPKIGSAHLWLNDGMRSEMNPIASNELAEAVLAAGLTGVLLRRFDETDAAGNYVAPPLAQDRVYMLSHEQGRSAPGGTALLVKVKLLDGQPDQIGFEAGDQPPTRAASAVTRGVRIDPANLPTRAHYYQNRKGNAPDVYQYSDLPLTVSARMKELIERFEPGKHQFFPLDFVDKKGNVTERRHIFVITALLDGSDKEKSTKLFERGWYNPGREQGEVVINRRAVAGHHIWRDQHLTGTFFISNDFAASLEQCGWPDLVFGDFNLVD